LIKQLASISPANARFIALGFLGKYLACMIAASDYKRSDRLRCTIGRDMFAKSGGRIRQENRMKTV
jgi:hypothetical protein